MPKHYQGKALSHLQGSFFNVFISLTELNDLQNTHRMHCCFTKAIVLMETRRSITWHINSFPCALRRMPTVIYNVARHNNVYVRNMSGFDIKAKLRVLCFDGHYCNELIVVLTETTIEPNYDKCNQYKGILFRTGRFIMFSVITNVYNKKTKGTTLMELFTTTGKLKKIFFKLEMFDECTHGDTAHIDTICKFLPHTRQHGCHRHYSLLQLSVSLGQRGYVAIVLCVLCTKCTLHSNHRLTRVIFQNTKRLLQQSGHFLTT